MRYLHGDSVPFSLNENFLETLCAATDACVAMIGVEVAADNERLVTEESDAAMVSELARLEALGQSVGNALDSHGVGESPNNMTEAAATRIMLLAKGALTEARNDVAAWRDGMIAAAHALVPQMLPILDTFLVRNKLPNTSWEFEWAAGMRGAPARAVIWASTPIGLDAVFDVAMPSNHLWAQAVRGATLQKGIAVPMMRKRWFGSPKLRDVSLDRYFVTKVTFTSQKASLVLSRSAKEPSPGIEITIRGSNPTGASTATDVDPNGKPIGEPAVLGGAGAAVVQQLWERIEATIADLVWYRRAVRSATFEGTPVGELRYPALLAKRIVEEIAPFVRELRQHSRSPGELALKRDLGDGRREELFITHDDVSRRYAGVTPRHRAIFDAFGLEGQDTVIVNPRAAGPRTRRPPAAEPILAALGG